MNKEKEDKKTFQEKANDYARRSIEEMAKMLEKTKSKNEKKAEEGREEIQNDPLEIATGKDFDGTRTYMILLGTGGPAARITGDLNEYGEPETARFQFQDWFKPWTTAQTSYEENQTMIEYARNFYFQEK